MSGDEAAASLDELDALPTEELRQQAFRAAEHNHDVRWFWDLVRHLPRTVDASSEDGSAGGITGSIVEVIGLFRNLAGQGYGASEPLLRAAFIDYLRVHPGASAAG